MIPRLLVLAISLSAFTTAALAQDPAPTAAKRYGSWGVDLAGMDPTIKPGDDFFRYVNGKWLATTQIPPGRTSYGSGAVLSELSEVRVRGIVDRWAADKKLKAASDEAKVASLYRTYLDEATVENSMQNRCSRTRPP